MNNLLSFLQSQKLISIAPKSNEPWIANAFYGVDNDCVFYFVSSTQTKHSQQILENGDVAFNVAWYNPNNHTDRKAIQGIGRCTMANKHEEIAIGVQLHNDRFPEFAERITIDWIEDPGNESKIWTLQPSYIKYWDDTLYKNGESKEFIFEK